MSVTLCVAGVFVIPEKESRHWGALTFCAENILSLPTETEEYFRQAIFRGETRALINIDTIRYGDTPYKVFIDMPVHSEAHKLVFELADMKLNVSALEVWTE